MEGEEFYLEDPHKCSSNKEVTEESDTSDYRMICADLLPKTPSRETYGKTIGVRCDECWTCIGTVYIWQTVTAFKESPPY